MRNFFKDILNTFKVYSGNDQLKNIYNSHQEPEDAEKEISTLLDALCEVSRLFSYIPEADQQKIIKKCLISDKEYNNLNARLINRWLTENGKIYFKEVAHIESRPPEDYRPLTPEEAQPFIDQLKANLEKIGKPERKEIEVHESPALKAYYADKQKFNIEGIEIWATDLEKARELYLMHGFEFKDDENLQSS